MKSHFFAAAALTVCACAAQAAPQHAHHHQQGPAHHAQTHAPAGVMYEHVHPSGEWMVDYHVRHSRRTTLFHQSNEVSDNQLQAAGFGGIPNEMTMQMHMLHVMYAPTDWLNLMLMPQYMSMDMSLTMVAGEHHSAHGHDGIGGVHDHGTSGIGDTVISALFRLYQQQHHALNAALALSAPTGSVSERGSDGRMVGYGMQLGSGTWDLLPTVTYTGSRAAIGWGVQVGASLPIESENDSGFRYPERYQATSWTAYRVNHWASFSLRLGYSKEGSISGHYNAPHNHSSPGDLQANYGGEYWDAGIGANLQLPPGPLAGQQLGVEWLERIVEHYRGYQLGGEQSLVLRWSTTF